MAERSKSSSGGGGVDVGGSGGGGVAKGGVPLTAFCSENKMSCTLLFEYCTNSLGRHSPNFVVRYKNGI
jgi:hypothetical protein